MHDESDQTTTPDPSARRKRVRTIGSAVALGAAGIVAGGIVAGTLSANAEGSPSSSAGSSAGPAAYGDTGGRGGGVGNGSTDPSKPMRSDEKLLTGTTRAKVLAAVKAKYPDATIQRVETDSDGVYEAHIVAGGTATIVQVGKDFTITGTQAGGHGGSGGDHDGNGPGGGSAEAPAA